MKRRDFLKIGIAAIGAFSMPALLSACTGAQVQSSDMGSSGTSSSEFAQNASDEPVSDTDFLFDTVVTLTVYGQQEALDAAMERCRYFENKFSRTVEGSDIWNINAAQGAPVEVSDETADIINKALDYCAASNGLFDITIGTVSSLWDFKTGVRPDDFEIAEAIKHIDYTGVKVEGNTVTLSDPASKLDLGGIAKGYIADDLKTLLSSMGVESACLNLGGNVAVLGTKPDGSPWNVGIQDPNGADQEVIAMVPCNNGSVVTSGLYERQFEDDGKTYYHILDPRTGYPVETDVVSSSLLTGSSTDGDAYATILFLMGADSAMDLLNSDDRFEGLIVSDDGEMLYSKNSTFEKV